MKSFNSFLTEEKKSVVFTFSRLNPPTIRHGKLIDAVAKAASPKSVYHVYVSHTQDKKKNPLDYQTKIKYVRKMFPKHARNVIQDSSVKTVLNVCVKLYNEGFTNVTMVVGSDRVTEFETLLNKYNNVKMGTGFYNFEGGVKVLSAGERDPDAEGISGMSASKMRSAAAENDFETFEKGLPSNFKEGKQLFLDVRKGLKDVKESKSKIEEAFKPKTKLRNQYAQGNLFKIADKIIINESNEIGTIVHLGANYLLIEKEGSSSISRHWIDTVTLYNNNTSNRNINKILKSIK